MRTLDHLLSQQAAGGMLAPRDAAALGFHRRIIEYLDDYDVASIAKLPSLWRSSNIVLRIGTAGGDFVFKYVSDIEAAREVEHIAELRRAYVGFLPKVFCREGQAYLMEYIPCKDFFTLCRETPGHDIRGRLANAGEALGRVLGSYRLEREPASGLSQLDRTLGHYHAKCMKSLQLPPAEQGAIGRDLAPWPAALGRYPGQVSHNDLNAANVLLCDAGIRAIDPEHDGHAVNDPARDIGRYAASIFCNTYDYFGKDGTLALGHLAAFLDGVASAFAPPEAGLWARVGFYIGQSGLSFANFNAQTPGIQHAYYRLGRALLRDGPAAYPDAGAVTARVASAWDEARRA
jgi:hypothetical protein